MAESGGTTTVIYGHLTPLCPPRSGIERRFGARHRSVDALLVFGSRHRLLGDCVASALVAAGVEVARVEASIGEDVRVSAPRYAALLIDSAVLDDCGGADLVDGVHQTGGMVLVIDTDPAPEHMSECGNSGADGVVAATQDLRALVAAVRRAVDATDVDRGRSSDSDAGHDRTGAASDRELLASLSPREEGVLHSMMCGLSTAERPHIMLHSMMCGLSAVEIAAAEFVAVSTVRSQIRSILTKLNVRSQLAAVAFAHDAGWNAAISANHRS